MREQPTNNQDQILKSSTLDGVSYRAFFHTQAKVAARFTLQVLNQEGISNPIILDLGCGGVIRNAGGQVTSHYRPFYAAELANAGLSRDQIIGLDVADPDPNLETAYTHIHADLLVILSSAESFISFLESKFSADQLKQLTLITSNNLFNNVAPALALEADRMLENLLSAAAILAARYNNKLKVINFDGASDMGTGSSVFALVEGEMEVHEDLNDAYNLEYGSTFEE